MILAELLVPEAVVENDLTDHANLPVLSTLLAQRYRFPIRTAAEFWSDHISATVIGARG